MGNLLVRAISSLNFDDDKPDVKLNKPDIKSKKGDKQDTEIIKTKPDLNEITYEEEK